MSDSVGNNHPVGGDQLYMNESEMDTPYILFKDKKYFEKYQGSGKEIYLFGVEFADRNVSEWVVQKTP